MDINELNKMSVVAQFGKLISQPNFGTDGAESFSGLLEKNVASAQNLAQSSARETDAPIEKNPVKNDVKSSDKEDTKEPSKVSDKESTKDKDPVKEKTETQEGKEKDTSKTEEIPQNDKAQTNKETENKDVPEQAVVAMASMENVPQNTMNTVENTIEEVQVSTINANSSEEILSSEKTSVEQVSDLMSNILSGKIEVLDAEGNILPQTQLTPENLANMQNITVKNTETGKVQQMTGMELSSQLFEVVPQEIAAPVISEEMAVVTDVAETQPMVMPNTKTSTTKNTLADNEVSEEAIAESGSENLTTEDAINELFSDKQIKVDVTVKEEKNAYFTNRELVKNGFTLNKTSEEGEAEAPIISATSQSTTVPSQNAQTNILPQQAQTAQIPQPNADDANTMQNLSGAELKTTAASSGSNSQSILSGAEFVAASRTDATEKNNQTSFKDVYKGMSKEAVEQVKVNITKSAVKGVDTIEVRLKPEELGHIEIKMQIKDGKLQAHIISTRPETMEALQKDAQILEKAFNDAGFQTDGNSLSFSYRQEGNQAQAQNEELRNFIGKVFEQEANSDVITSEAANQNWTAEKGLNIRV